MLFRCLSDFNLVLEHVEKYWHDFLVLLEEVGDAILREVSDSDASCLTNDSFRVRHGLNDHICVHFNFIFNRVKERI